MLADHIPQAWHAWLSLGIVAIMFTLFVRESYPTEVVSIGGVAFLLFTGGLPYETALGVFSNPAPWTIAAMFILSGALVRTGARANARHAWRQRWQGARRCGGGAGVCGGG